MAPRQLALDEQFVSPPETKLCGISFHPRGRLGFLGLAVSAIVSAVGFAALQEGVTRSHGFHFFAYLTLMSQLTAVACGQLERLLTNDLKRNGGIRQYMWLSLLTFTGAQCTNWALAYLNYPTRVLFKSSKLLPTMAVGTLMQGRRYSVLEYVAAAGLVAGIVLFTLGDAETVPSFETTGVVLIMVGVIADAATSNYEERNFFRIAVPSMQPEVIVYSSLLGRYRSQDLQIEVCIRSLFPCASISHTRSVRQRLGSTTIAH